VARKRESSIGPWLRVPRIVISTLLTVSIIPLGNFLLEAFFDREVRYTDLVLALIILMIAAVLIALLQIEAKLVELLETHRTRVRFLVCDYDNPDTISQAYREIRKIVIDVPEGADTEIFALNSFLEAMQEPPTGGNQARLQYYRSLEAKHVNYHRILQVDETDTEPPGQRIQPGYAGHYRRMVELKAKRPGYFIAIQRARAIFPFSFVLVDPKEGPSYLFWQVDQHIPNNSIDEERFRVAGYMIVTDPDRAITRHFRELFFRVANDYSTKNVRIEDFPISGDNHL
jgi:hypothetical protein